MKTTELVKAIKNDKPQLFSKVSEKQATALVRHSLLYLARQIKSLEEGTIKVQGLGSFHVRNVVRKKGGEEVTVRQVVFHAAKPKPADKP